MFQLEYLLEALPLACDSMRNFTYHEKSTHLSGLGSKFDDLPSELDL